jgi:hypothetical protein
LHLLAYCKAHDLTGHQTKNLPNKVYPVPYSIPPKIALVKFSPLLVEERRDEAGEGLGLHVPLLPQLIQLVPKHQPLVPAQCGESGNRDSQRLCIGGEPREADVEFVMDLEHPLEIGGDGLRLNAQAPVTGDREAVLSHHRHHGGPVVLEDLRGAGGGPVRDPRSGERGGRAGGARGSGYSPTWPELRRGRAGGFGPMRRRRGAEQGSKDGGGLMMEAELGFLVSKKVQRRRSRSDLSSCAVRAWVCIRWLLNGVTSCLSNSNDRV